MAKLPRTGSYRTDIALRTVAQCDFEATGQFPARRQNRRRRLPPVFLSSLVAVISAKPAAKPRRGVERVVEIESSGCGFCQSNLVRAVAAIAIGWLAAVGFFQTEPGKAHLRTHQEAPYG